MIGRGLALFCALFAGALAHAQLQPPGPSLETPGRALMEGLKIRGALTPRDTTVIESAAELNPRILDAAAERASASTNPRGFAIQATQPQLDSVLEDLLNRAKLQAIRSEVVPVSPEQRQELLPSLLWTDVPALNRVALPKGLESAIFDALKDKTLVVHPLCPPAFALNLLANTSPCIKGDKWSEELFKSVVSITLDGKRTCTGSALGDGMILTAAHCVIEPVNGVAAVRASSRFQVVSLAGKVLPLIAEPQVPKQMMFLCLMECPDMQYDFAILRVDPAFAEWAPIPVVTRLIEVGDVPITLAGYGTTNMPANSSKSGLYIGPQNIKLSKVDQALEWKYNMASDGNNSSSCFEDSGGPIYHGRPRNVGDSLTLIGLISRFTESNSQCANVDASAVNFTQEGPRSVLCDFSKNKLSLCTP